MYSKLSKAIFPVVIHGIERDKEFISYLIV